MCFFQRYRFVCIYTSLIDLYINYIYIYYSNVIYVYCHVYYLPCIHRPGCFFHGFAKNLHLGFHLSIFFSALPTVVSL